MNALIRQHGAAQPEKEIEVGAFESFKSFGKRKEI
jgi:hypothetical protein